MWLKRFLYHLDVVRYISQPVVVYNDSEAMIAYTKPLKYHWKTKHIDTRFNYVRDLTTQNELNMMYILTHEMLADPFTNSILRDVFRIHMEFIGLQKSNVLNDTLFCNINTSK